MVIKYEGVALQPFFVQKIVRNIFLCVIISIYKTFYLPFPKETLMKKLLLAVLVVVAPMALIFMVSLGFGVEMAINFALGTGMLMLTAVVLTAIAIVVENKSSVRNC